MLSIPRNCTRQINPRRFYQAALRPPARAGKQGSSCSAAVGCTRRVPPGMAWDSPPLPVPGERETKTPTFLSSDLEGLAAIPPVRIFLLLLLWPSLASLEQRQPGRDVLYFSHFSI